MCSVWNAPATLSGISRAFSGGSSANAASCSMVPAATIWPGPLSLAAVRPCLSIAASTSSRSPPSTAVMPVGVAAAAPAIALPRSRTRTIACSAVITRAPAAAVELADAVAGDRARPCRRRRSGAGRSRAPRPARSRPAAAGRSRCARICVGVRLGAVVDQVEPGHGRQPLEAGPERVVLEPGGEEAGGLGALAGRDDDEHGLHSAQRPGPVSPPAPTNLARRFFVGFLQRTWQDATSCRQARRPRSGCGRPASLDRSAEHARR